MNDLVRHLGRIRALVFAALDEAGVRLSDGEWASVQASAIHRGVDLLPHALVSLGDGCEARLAAAARSLGLDQAVLARVLGFGWQQADALAEAAAVPAAARAEAAHLGALFNLGIALFDYHCDRLPARAALLLDRVTPAALEAALAGGSGVMAATGDPGVDVLLTLITEFFARSLRLAGSAAPGGQTDPGREFAALIGTMYAAERFAAEARRDRTPPTLAVLRALRRKSALPLWTMVVVGLLGRGAVPGVERERLRRIAGLAGEALWLIDDLADVREDWDSGGWSRPLWLLARNSIGRVPADAAEAVGLLLDTGIAAAEASRLAGRLAHLRRNLGAGHPLVRSLQATVQSWACVLPAL